MTLSLFSSRALLPDAQPCRVGAQEVDCLERFGQNAITAVRRRDEPTAEFAQQTNQQPQTLGVTALFRRKVKWPKPTIVTPTTATTTKTAATFGLGVYMCCFQIIQVHIHTARATCLDQVKNHDLLLKDRSLGIPGTRSSRIKASVRFKGF